MVHCTPTRSALRARTRLYGWRPAAAKRGWFEARNHIRTGMAWRICLAGQVCIQCGRKALGAGGFMRGIREKFYGSCWIAWGLESSGCGRSMATWAGTRLDISLNRGPAANPESECASGLANIAPLKHQIPSVLRLGVYGKGSDQSLRKRYDERTVERPGCGGPGGCGLTKTASLEI